VIVGMRESPVKQGREVDDINVVIARSHRVRPSVGPMINSATKQSSLRLWPWIASSRSLSSGAHSRDPLARNDEEAYLKRTSVPAGSV
jgi:hypothetical protein